MSKKILIFSTAYLPLIGGAEMAVKEITDKIDEYDFFLITARLDKKLSKRETIGRIQVFRIGFGNQLDKFLLVYWGLKKAKQLMRQHDFSIIWSIMASQASIVAAFFKKKYPQAKLLLTLQEGDEEEHLKRYVGGNNFLYKFLIRPWHLLVFKRADYVQAISNDLATRAKKNKVLCPIEVVPNAVDIKNFSRTFLPDQLQNLKNKLTKKDSDRFLITTSRLVTKNAISDVIKSLVYLPDNIKFLILGDGPDRADLNNLCKKLKVANRVKFLGLVSHEEMPMYLRVSDIFIRPSLSEGLGNSFLEAMAAGLPVIATQIGGIPDFLFDPDINIDKKSTGLFCKVSDPQDIAKQVRRLLDNKKLKEEIINNAKELVIQKYDWNIVARDMEKIFNKLIN